MPAPPYHAGSVLMPFPPLFLDPDRPGEPVFKIRLIDRITAYYRRNAEAGMVMRALLSFAQPGKPLFCTLATVASQACVTVKTAWRWTTRFAADGFLTRIRRRTLDHKQTSNAYVLNFGELPPKTVDSEPAEDPDARPPVCLSVPPPEPQTFDIPAPTPPPAAASAANCPSNKPREDSLSEGKNLVSPTAPPPFGQPGYSMDTCEPDTFIARLTARCTAAMEACWDARRARKLARQRERDRSSRHKKTPPPPSEGQRGKRGIERV